MDIRRATLVSATLVLTFLLAACATATPDQATEESDVLLDSEWVLISLNGNVLIEDTEITLNFGEASLDGAAGCNTYGGSYTASGDSLRLSGVYATEMACPEPKGILDQEQAYLNALNTAARYRVEGDRLELYDEAGAEILAFVASPMVSEEPTTPAKAIYPESQESGLTAKIDVPTSLNSRVSVMAIFTLTNTSSDGFYVLKWFTPLEGIAGDIFRVERDGAELPYRGKLVKRGPPISEDYVWLEAGESVSAEINLAEGYDFSQAGQYTIQFRSPQTSQIAKTEAEKAASFEELGMIQIPSNTVSVVVESLSGSDSGQPSAALVDTQWVLTSLNGSALIAGTEITLNFEEASLNGSAGCNTYGGGYAVSGNGLRLSDVYATEMGCMEPEGILKQEQAYLNALHAAARFRVEGDRLEVYDEAGAQSLAFVTAGSVAVQSAPSPPTEPPAGFKLYQDSTAGVSVYVPESWTVTEIVSGQSAKLLSYPENKYVGGEARQPGDTRCHLTILRPQEVDVASHIQQLRSSDMTVVSEGEIVLQSGKPGYWFEMESMGRFFLLVTEINERVVRLTCFGDYAPFEQIAVTLDVAEVVGGAPAPAAALQQYQDSAAGVSIHVPGDWVVTGIVSGHTATLQSFSEGKYIGGGDLQPGDTKCDLNIRPQGENLADFVQQMRTNSAITIISDDEITLESGKPGTRIEFEGLGRYLLLITEINERVVVLTCFGDFTLFDEIAATLNVIE